MSTLDRINCLHAEKMVERSRENERGFLCDGCVKDPESCGSSDTECAEAIQDRQGEEQFEARRDDA